MFKRCLFVGTIIYVSLCLGFPVAAGTKIRVGYIVDLSLTPFFVALEKGYFEELGLELDLKEYTSGRDSYTAVKGGSVDISHNMGANAAAKFHTQGIGIYYVHNLITTPHFKVLCQKDAPYKTLTDLKGKIYSCTSFAGTTFALSSMAFDALGMDIMKDLEIKTFPPAVMQVELERGGVDAGILWEPRIYKVLKHGKLRILADPGSIYFKKFNKNFVSAGTVSMKEFFEKNRGAVKKYVSAFLKGVKFTLENKEEANKIHAAHWKGFEAEDIAIMREAWGDAWVAEEINDQQIRDMQFMYDKMMELTDYFKTKPIAKELVRKP